MQDCDLLTPPALDLLDPAVGPASYEGANDEPALRYEVESMQHWLDLNA
jgi:hypothetical protein